MRSSQSGDANATSVLCVPRALEAIHRYVDGLSSVGESRMVCALIASDAVVARYVLDHRVIWDEVAAYLSPVDREVGWREVEHRVADHENASRGAR